MTPVQLRPVDSGDCETLFAWANDPGTRAMSFSTAPIPWDTHTAWFSAKLADPSCRMYLACAESGEPVGHVRFDIEGDHAVVSIVVAPDHRGFGIGKDVLNLGIRRLFDETDVCLIEAFVREANDPSLALFRRCGFGNEIQTAIRGCPAVRLLLGRPSDS